MSYRPYSELRAAGIEDTKVNNTGVEIQKATPVRINSSGDLDFINVSVEAESLSVAGVSGANIADGSPGSFVTTGKITNISTSAAFGDIVYISKSGGLTNTKPSIGVGGFVPGDFVIAIGVISKNDSNPLNKDLVINIDIVGQL